ncbi:Proclotting enzyme [Smittium mucronatum]|uniref:Proclotting enzyme n=1 Tax=Smittium mucronatum TaxID=133383 RepID=A0A1R0H8S2_9FUNG|nr:Proclotting enzyme [Smittium mucronatum]
MIFPVVIIFWYLVSVSAQTNQVQQSVLDRILNGFQATSSSFQYASFIYINLGSTGVVCTGSLISSNAILTAAHCLVNSSGSPYDSSEVSVSVGSLENIQSNPNIYGASSLITHPKYDRSAKTNDIGIILLKSSVTQVSQFAKIYDLPVQSSIQLQAAGWGVTSNDPSSQAPSSTLIYAPISISSSDSCLKYNSNWSGNNGPVICTQNVNGQDTCFGDSGGPLAVSSDSSRPILGITSFGVDPSSNSSSLQCGADGGFGYYTNANYYIDWISSTSSVSTSDLVFSSFSSSGSSSSSSQSSLVQSGSSSQSSGSSNQQSSSSVGVSDQSSDISSTVSIQLSSTSPDQSSSLLSQTSSNLQSATSTSASSLIGSTSSASSNIDSSSSSVTSTSQPSLSGSTSSASSNNSNSSASLSASSDDQAPQVNQFPVLTVVAFSNQIAFASSDSSRSSSSSSASGSTTATTTATNSHHKIVPFSGYWILLVLFLI